MGILSKASAKISEIRKARRSGKETRLLEDTAMAESRLKSEAKKLGIDISNVTSKNYYEILGIKYTNDQKAIRRAYLGMVKKYHPDINTEKSAAARSTEINEAYAVLKDGKSKSEYDSSFSKGRNNMGPEVTKSILDILMKGYSEARNRDFKEFNERVATPQSMEAVSTAISEVLDWNSTLNAVRKKTFGGLMDSGKAIRRLASANRNMLKSGGGKEDYGRLKDNLEGLESMEMSFNKIEKGINAIISGATKKIQEEENVIASKLRG